MNIKIEKCPAYHDSRGDLVQFITKQVLSESGLPFGQVYLLTFSGKNLVRGNHYHTKSFEIFCLISGSVQMVFKEVATQKHLEKIITVKDNEFFRVIIGPNIIHAIKSLSDFAVMVSFSSTEYDNRETDKFSYKLL